MKLIKNVCCVCGCEITDDIDAWECDGCGGIVCNNCGVDGDGYCDNCHDEREENYWAMHGFAFGDPYGY